MVGDIGHDSGRVDGAGVGHGSGDGAFDGVSGRSWFGGAAGDGLFSGASGDDLSGDDLFGTASGTASGGHPFDDSAFYDEVFDGRDLVAVLADDRGELESLLSLLEDLPPGHAWRRPLTDRLIMEVVRHAATEERYLHPAARRFLADGDRVVEHGRAEHVAAEALMKRLERPELPDREHAAALTELISLVRRHLHEEETVLFPRLVEAATPEDLRELGREAGAAIRRLTTRPHPSLPDEPPFDRLVAPDASLVERTRALVTGERT